MGEKEFIFELRGDNNESYAVTINTSTWLGLNYIGSKSEQELQDLQELINNKQWILVDNPKNVEDNMNILADNIKAVSDALSNFINDSYNPTVESIGQTFDALNTTLNDLSIKISEIDGNLLNLQGQIDSINSRLDGIESRISSNSDSYNNTIQSMAENPDGGWSYWLMS